MGLHKELQKALKQGDIPHVRKLMSYVNNGCIMFNNKYKPTDSKDISFSHPLLWCAMFGHADSVQSLLDWTPECRDKINMFDEFGMTALMYAIENLNYKITHILIENGAFPWVFNPLTGQLTPTFCWHRVELYPVEVLYLTKLCMDKIMWYFKKEDMTDHYFNKTHRTVDGTNLWLQAVRQNSVDLLKLLIQYPIDIDQKDIKGFTDIDIAESLEYWEMAQWLRELHQTIERG